MSHPNHDANEVEPRGPEGVPVDAPDNTAPAISPHAVSRMHRREDDIAARKHSPEFSDEQNIAIDDRVSGEAWIPGKSGERGPRKDDDEGGDRTQHVEKRGA